MSFDSDQVDVLERYKERAAIEATHSWLFRCFPPQPTVCTICHAEKSDPDLQPCIFASLDA